MTTAPAIDEQETEYFDIEQIAKVYLEWSPVTKGWVIGPITMDGHPLDGYDEVDSDLDRQHWTEAMKADAKEAAAINLPNGEELTRLLLAALPFDTETGAALSVVIKAAEKWGSELTEYVTAAEEAQGDTESAAGHHDEAADIAAAVALLTGTHQ